MLAFFDLRGSVLNDLCDVVRYGDADDSTQERFQIDENEIIKRIILKNVSF